MYRTELRDLCNKRLKGMDINGVCGKNYTQKIKTSAKQSIESYMLKQSKYDSQKSAQLVQERKQVKLL